MLRWKTTCTVLFQSNLMITINTINYGDYVCNAFPFSWPPSQRARGVRECAHLQLQPPLSTRRRRRAAAPSWTHGQRAKLVELFRFIESGASVREARAKIKRARSGRARIRGLPISQVQRNVVAVVRQQRQFVTLPHGNKVNPLR